MFIGQYGAAQTFSFPVIAAGAQNFQANPTLAAGDALVSTDGGATANADNIPAVTPAAGDTIEWTASADEMSGKRVVLILSDAAGAQWEDQMITVYTYGHANAHFPLDLSALVKVDIGALGGDTSALANFQATYDGAGYSDPHAPAKQSQLDTLANVGSAVNKEMTSFVITTGNEDVNTFANTEERDGVLHELSDDTGTFDAYYETNVGADGVPARCQVTGFLNSSNDALTVYAWKWSTTEWKVLGTIQGKNPSGNEVYSFDMYGSHAGTGADLGKVRIRFAGAGLTSAALKIDQLFVAHSVVNRSAGYANGAVWVDTLDGTDGTVVDTNGVVDNPSRTFADALVIAAGVPLKRFEVAAGSVITLTAAFEGKILTGTGWTLDLNGQSISNSTFVGASVSGAATGVSAKMVHCDIQTATLPACCYEQCHFKTVITLSAASDYLFDHCSSDVAGSGTPTIDFGAAVGATSLSIRHYSGGIHILNMQAGDKMSLEGDGQYILNANCAGGELSVRGNFSETDNSGNVAVTQDARYASSQVASAVWNAILANYLAAGSTGAQLNAAGGGTPGANSVVLHTQTALGVTIGQVAVTIKDEPDTSTLRQGESGASDGDLPVSLNDGTYQIHQVKTGHDPVSSPQEIVVSGDGTFNILIEPIAIIATDDPTKCTVHGQVVDAGGTPRSGKVIYVRSVVPQTSQGLQHCNDGVSTTTDANGRFTLDLVRETNVALSLDGGGYRDVTFIVPDLGTQDLATWAPA